MKEIRSVSFINQIKENTMNKKLLTILAASTLFAVSYTLIGDTKTEKAPTAKKKAITKTPAKKQFFGITQKKKKAAKPVAKKRWWQFWKRSSKKAKPGVKKPVKPKAMIKPGMPTIKTTKKPANKKPVKPVAKKAAQKKAAPKKK